MKKFEPHYRLVRVGMANKIEKASRQQRTSCRPRDARFFYSLLTHPPQASNARTDRRSSEVPPRSRVPRRTRNRRFYPPPTTTSFAWRVWCVVLVYPLFVVSLFSPRCGNENKKWAPVKSSSAARIRRVQVRQNETRFLAPNAARCFLFVP